MGLVIGAPVFLAGLRIKDSGQFAKAFVVAAVAVVVVTLTIGLVALGFGYTTIETAPRYFEGVSDPVAFARAGMMHNFSYLGGLIGLFVGCGLMVFRGSRAGRSS